jgi:3-methyl-2-oxobutanoate hydroxymethyltransferase
MKTIKNFKMMKQKGEKITMLTAYDYYSARFCQQSGVDLILVGDSLGMVIQGHQDTLQVSLDDIIYHCQMVRRGADDTFVIADLPFMSYHLSLEETKENAALCLIEGKANAVKLEGGKTSRLHAIEAIVDCEIPVVGHLGLTPQSINVLGGYSVQGKTKKDYELLKKQALDIQKAGAFMLVLESIPESLGKEISENLKIPTIGIGAGRFTDGQVLVYHDVLGMSDLQPKFLKTYAELNQDICRYLSSYCDDVKNKKFPDAKHVYLPLDDEKQN